MGVLVTMCGIWTSGWCTLQFQSPRQLVSFQNGTQSKEDLAQNARYLDKAHWFDVADEDQLLFFTEETTPKQKNKFSGEKWNPNKMQKNL